MKGVEHVLGRMLRHASSLSGEGGRRNLSSMVKVLNMGPGGAVVVVTWIFISYDLYRRCVFLILFLLCVDSVPMKERSSVNVASSERS